MFYTTPVSLEELYHENLNGANNECLSHKDIFLMYESIVASEDQITNKIFYRSSLTFYHFEVT